MKLQVQSELQAFKNQIGIGDPVVLIGSCFSNDMAIFFQNCGIETCVNPFGVLFHPVPIGNTILDAIRQNQNVRTIQRGELYFSWDASGILWSEDENKLKEQILNKQEALRLSLKHSNAKLIVTFGTTFAYKHFSDTTVVANCHKLPSSEFKKEFSDYSELVVIWETVLTELKAFNPDISIFCTVSPVRHLKDGLIENTRSKSRLIELCYHLTKLGVEYVPSYELIIDELRDYRFFERDLVHPNQLAREYLWEKLFPVLMKSEELAAFEAVQKYHAQLDHRTLFPGTKEDSKRIVALEQTYHSLLESFPNLVLRK
jgi:hypothetical protein